MTKTEKINFNIQPELKRDIERLASSYGKNLSVFMLDICKILQKNNSQRIKEQTAREKEPINFGDITSNTKPKKSKMKGNTKNIEKAGGENDEG